MNRTLAFFLIFLTLGSSRAWSGSSPRNLLELELRELKKSIPRARIGRRRAKVLTHILEQRDLTRRPQVRHFLATLQELELRYSMGNTGNWKNILPMLEESFQNLLQGEVSSWKALDQNLLPNQRARLLEPPVRRFNGRLPGSPKNGREQALLAAWKTFYGYQSFRYPHLIRKIKFEFESTQPNLQERLKEYRNLRRRLLSLDLQDRLQKGRILQAWRVFLGSSWSQAWNLGARLWGDLSDQEQGDLTLALYSLGRKLAWVLRRFDSLEELTWIP
jgi:hypothetical protein